MKIKSLLLAAVCLTVGLTSYAQTVIVTNPVAGSVQASSTPTPISVVTLTNPLGNNPSINHGLQEVFDAALMSTNGAVAVVGGRSLKGKNNLAALDYVYNFNENAGIIVGGEYLWTSQAGVPSSTSFVKGGINLQATIAPFKSWPNFKLTPFAALLIATSGNNDVTQISVAGVDWASPQFWKLKAHIGGEYENRTGSNSHYNGAYGLVHSAFSWGF